MQTLPLRSGSAELLAWLPIVAGRVLELGCRDLDLADGFRRRNPLADYTTIKTLADLAEAIGSGGEPPITIPTATEADVRALGGRPFNAIVISDALEQLAEPQIALRQLRHLLVESGSLVLSLPNITHWSALEALVCGRSPGVGLGSATEIPGALLTPDALTKLLRQTGFEVLKIRPINDPGDRARAERVIPVLADAAERLGQDRRAFVARANARAYLLVARKALAGYPSRMLRLHISAMAPRFLDVRARLPAEALNSLPDIHVTRAEKTLQLPAYPVDAPKVCVLQRLSIANEPAFKAWVRDRIREGWVLVAESDDHPALLAAVHGRDPEKESWLSVTGVHAVQTSTPALAEAYRSHNPEVAVFPNAVFSLPPFVERSGQLRVFLGALNRERVTAQVARSLADFCKAHPVVEFVVVHDRAFFDALPSTRKTFHPAADYDSYLNLLGDCHVALMPLEGTFGETFKSDVKFLEAASRSVVAIASPAVYENTIVDGETGLIAIEMDDWTRRLSALAADQSLRQRLARNAWEYVRRERMFAAQADTRRRWYNGLWDRRDQLTAVLLSRSR